MRSQNTNKYETFTSDLGKTVMIDKHTKDDHNFFDVQNITIAY